MRILHLIDSEGFYGAEKVVLALASESAKLGHKVTIGIVAKKNDNNAMLEAAALTAGVSVSWLPLGRGLSFLEIKRVLEDARRAKIDIIHSHSYKPNILLACIPRGARPCPVMATLHGRTSARHLKRLAVYHAVERWLLRRLDSIVFVDRSLQQRLSNRVDPDLSFHIPNGIPGWPHDDDNPSGEAFAGNLDVPRNRPFLLAAGRLSYEKGFDLLLMALRQLHETAYKPDLVIAGQGPEKQRLLDQAKKLGLSDSLFLPGYQPDMSLLFASASIFIMPSRSEGLPLALLEAMAFGVPVIATSVGAIPAVLKNGNVGTLIEPGSAEAIAHAITDHLKAPERTAARAKIAKSYVLSNYSSGAMTRRYNEIYTSLAA